jgi:amino acid permease
MKKSSISATLRRKTMVSTFNADKMLRNDMKSREFWPNRIKCITFGTMISSSPVTLSKLLNLCVVGGTIKSNFSSNKHNQIIHTITKATIHHIYRLRILTCYDRRQVRHSCNNVFCLFLQSIHCINIIFEDVRNMNINKISEISSRHLNSRY